MTIRYFTTCLAVSLAASSAWTQHTVSLPARLADPGVQVQGVLEGLSYSEGPAVDAAGNLFFSENPDVNDGRIWKVTPEGVKTAYKDPSRGSNGLEFDNQGRLHIAMLDSVLRVETDGKVTALAARSSSLPLGRVNDLSVASTGAMFFTNYTGNTVFFRGTDGQIRTRSFNTANGVEWIEEKGILYIASGGLQKCKVNNATGEISACANFAGDTDGLTTDVEGNVYRASWSEGRIYVNDSTGTQLGFIAITAGEPQGKRFTAGKGGNASNCHFGGTDRKTLYVTGDGGCYKVQLKVAGRQRPSSPTGVRPPGLTAGSGKAFRREGSFLAASGIIFQGARMNPVAADGRKAFRIRH